MRHIRRVADQLVTHRSHFGKKNSYLFGDVFCLLPTGLLGRSVFFSKRFASSDAEPTNRPIGHFGDSTFFSSNVVTDKRQLHEKYDVQFEEVKSILRSKNTFTSELIEKEALNFYKNLGLNEYYFLTSSSITIANNLSCVLAAKILDDTSHNKFFPVIRQESVNEIFWLTKASLKTDQSHENFLVEKQLEEKYLGFSTDPKVHCNTWRMQCYRSVGSIFSNREHEHLRTYFLQRPIFTPNPIDGSTTDLKCLLDENFYNQKKGTATEEIFDELNKKVVEDSTGQDLFINVAKRRDEYRLDLAFRRGEHNSTFFSSLGDCITGWGLYSQRKYIEPLRNGVSIVTTFVRELPEGEQLFNSTRLSVEEKIERLLKSLHMLYIMPSSGFSELAQRRSLSIHEAAYSYAACNFVCHFSSCVGSAFFKVSRVLEDSDKVSPLDLNEIRTKLKQPPFTEDDVLKAVTNNIPILKRLYREFQQMHHTSINDSQVGDSTLAQDTEKIDEPDVPEIFRFFQIFNRNILRTNFWKEQKMCLSFRLNPNFLTPEDYPDRPYAVTFLVGSEFQGFHVRFADVARGGIRIVLSYSAKSHEYNKRHIFDECYKLAHTQNYKNKDIPEGGSKGVLLLNRCSDASHALTRAPLAFKRFVDGMLDVLLPNERVKDRLQKTEICFLGPDEHTGTGGLMDWGAFRAKQRGAWFWKAFTTGKEPKHGGIPHDQFGMTTASVEMFVQGIFEKYNLEEQTITKCQIGGPDGDLGSNSILQSQCKLTSLIDSAGVLYDPEGLSKKELVRLVLKKINNEPTNGMMYDPKLLSSKGFKVSISDKDIVLPDGTLVPSGLQFRNSFHLNPLSTADLFNPCGGRPESVHPGNVNDLFHESSGLPRFKFIVEGANVFITNDARRILEKKGVVLFKDASANKGGVTSSSFEVLAALALSDQEFSEHMVVKDVNSPPEFYKSYVSEIIERIKENARLEFETLWSEGLRTGKPRCDLTDILSKKIITMKQAILSSDCKLWEDDKLTEVVLCAAIPKTLLPDFISLHQLRERVPETYLKAIFASFLAARFCYKFGIDANPFAFFDYVQNLKLNRMTG